MSGEFAYVGPPYLEHRGRVFIPDVRMTILPHNAHLHPLRGYSASLAVFVPHGDELLCVGWVPIEVVGFYTAFEWMEDTNYNGREAWKEVVE